MIGSISAAGVRFWRRFLAGTLDEWITVQAWPGAPSEGWG